MQENIVIGIDSRPADRGGDQVIRKLSDIKKGADGAGASLDRLGRGTSGVQRLGTAAGGASRQMAYLHRDIEQTRRATDGLNAGMATGAGAVQRLTGLWRTFAGVLAGIGLFALGRAFITATDEMKRMEAQIRLTLRGTTSFAQAFGDVQRIASNTRSDLGAVTDLYGRVARQAAQLGITSKEAATMTENFAYTLKISGATAMETAAVMRQFSQAMARGTLRGDEFISMMEGNPRAIKLFADSLGIAQGTLIEMAKEGKLSGDVLVKALTDPIKASKQLQQEMQMVPMTFGDAMTKVQNTATIVFSAFDRGGQFSTALVNFVTGGADDISTLGVKFEQFGIRVRSIFDGLASLFDPMKANGASFFGFLEEQVRGLQMLIQEILGAIDVVQNFRVRVNNNLVSALRTPGQEVSTAPAGTSWAGTKHSPMVYWERSNLLEQFQKSTAASAAAGSFAMGVRNINDSTPANMPFRLQVGADGRVGVTYAPGLNEGAAVPTPPGDDSATKTRTPQQIMLDFKRELHARGVGTASDYRSAAKQNSLYQQGLTPLDGYKNPSRHQSYQAIDLNRSTFDENKVYEAAQAAGLKGFEVITESGGRKHAQWTGGGKPGDMSDMVSAAEQLAKQLADATENVRKYQQGLTDSNMALEAANGLWAQHLQGSSTALERLSQINREAETNNAILENRQRWGDAWAQLSEADKANQDSIAASLARQRMDAETMAGIMARRGAEMEKAKQDAAQIAALTTDEWRAGRQMLDDERVRLAIDAERQELLRTKADLSSEIAKSAMAAAGAAEREAIARERTVAALSAYKSAAATASPLGAQMANREDYETKLEQYVVAYTYRLNDALEKNDLDRAARERQLYSDVIADAKREYFRVNAEIANQFRDKMLQTVSDLANSIAELIGGKTGQKVGGIVGGIGSMAALFKGAKGFGTDENPWGSYRSPKGMSPLGDTLGGVNDLLGQLFPKQMAPGGSMAGIGNMLGQASMGAAVGSATAPIGKAIMGSKYSTTGAQVGGSIGYVLGSMTPLGPIGGMIGSLIGSALGGIVGGMFKKEKSATATITDVTSDPSVTGKKAGGEYDTAATALAKSVQGALQQIATAVGATIGEFSVSIGMKGDKFTAGGQSFATEKEAVVHAIKMALQQGALVGLSSASNRVLTGASDPLAVLDAVAAYEQLEMQLLKLKDPIAGAFDEMVKGFIQLRAQMIAAGYTVEELGALEELYAEQRKQMLEAMKQPYLDFIQQLTQGPDSGLSVQGQYNAALGDLTKMQRALKAGEPVDQDEFLRVSSTVIGLAGQLYGTSTAEYAAIRDRLVRLTELAMAQVDALAPEETLAAEIAKAGGETVTAITTTNGLLTEIRDLLAGGSSAAAAAWGAPGGSAGASAAGGSLGDSSYGGFLGDRFIGTEPAPVVSV